MGKRRKKKSTNHSAPTTEITWRSKNFIELLRDLGPGICTISGGDSRSMEFDISENGWFGIEKIHHALICAKLYGMFSSNKPSGVIVRTLTRETVCVLHGTEKDRLVRVPVKELRGYRVYVVEKSNKEIILDFEKLSPDELREYYGCDYRTGKHIGLTVDERDHRFV